ncbi:MAG: glucosamine-6-phosphate deaminase [Kiritimatiellales bacterium]
MIKINKFETEAEAGRAAAEAGANAIRAAIHNRGEASIIVATGASQFRMLEALIRQPDIAWNRINVFHLDEYIGIPITHPASFRRYLWERFHSKLPVPVKTFHYIDTENDPEAECRRLSELIKTVSIDVCFCGIGENAHLAFNDPPADFETDSAYILVKLDDACRQQQLGEGWFPALNDVPEKAISMSIQQMLKSEKIICTIPGKQKAVAVDNTLSSEISPQIPATILKTHRDATFYLDRHSASLLK